MPGYSGAWRAAMPPPQLVPAPSLPANPLHSRGSIPEGKPPIGGPVQDIPLEIQTPDAWSAWGEHDVPQWDDFAGTDTTTHNAYATTGGATGDVARAEGNAWRGADAGMSQARSAHDMKWAERNENTILNVPHFADAGTPVHRGARAGVTNNPDGIPGHMTPRVTVRNQRRLPTPHRTFDEYSYARQRIRTATTTRPVPNDRYGSPFISSANAVAYPAGGRQPSSYTYPGLWDTQLAATNTVDGPQASVVEMGTETGWDNGF